MALLTETCQRHYTCQLLRGCLGFLIPDTQKHIVMFYAYCDESGHPADSTVVTVAAVVSNGPGWCAFSEQWAQTLQQYGISTFHMTDYENCRGEFKEWKRHQKKHRLLIADLSKIFRETLEFACVFSVAMEDWKVAMQRVNFVDHRLKTVGPWPPLFLTCAEAIYRTAMIPSEEKLSFWFEDNRLLKAPVKDQFTAWKKTQGFDDRLLELTFSDKGTHCGFQAADLLAYEGRKHHLNQYVEGGKRDERKLHKTLLRSRIVEERIFTQRGLQDYLLKNHSRNGTAPPSASQGEPDAEPRPYRFAPNAPTIPARANVPPTSSWLAP